MLSLLLNPLLSVTSSSSSIVSARKKILTGRDTEELKPHLSDRSLTLNVYNQVQHLTSYSLQTYKLHLLLSLWLQTFIPIHSQYAALIKKKSYTAKYATSHGFPSSEEMSKFLSYVQDLTTLYALLHICEPYLTLYNSSGMRLAELQQRLSKSKHSSSTGGISSSLNTREPKSLLYRDCLCQLNKIEVYIDKQPVKSTNNHSTNNNHNNNQNSMTKKMSTPLTIDTANINTNMNTKNTAMSYTSDAVYPWIEQETLEYLYKYHMYLNLDVMLAACSAVKYHECIEFILHCASHDLELQQGIEVLNQVFYITTATATAAALSRDLKNTASVKPVTSSQHSTEFMSSNNNSYSNSNSNTSNTYSKQSKYNIIATLPSNNNTTTHTTPSSSTNNMYNSYHEHISFLSSMQLTLEGVLNKLSDTLNMADFRLLACLITAYVPFLLHTSQTQYLQSNETILLQRQSPTLTSASVTVGGSVSALKNNKRQYERIINIAHEMLFFVYPYIRPQTVKHILLLSNISTTVSPSTTTPTSTDIHIYTQQQQQQQQQPSSTSSLSSSSSIDLYDDVMQYTHILSESGQKLFHMLRKNIFTTLLHVETSTTSAATNTPNNSTISHRTDDDRLNVISESMLMEDLLFTDLITGSPGNPNQDFLNTIIIQSYRQITRSNLKSIDSSPPLVTETHTQLQTQTNKIYYLAYIECMAVNNLLTNIYPDTLPTTTLSTATSGKMPDTTHSNKNKNSRSSSNKPLVTEQNSDNNIDINNTSDSVTDNADTQMDKTSHYKVYFKYLSELMSVHTYNNNNNNNTSSTTPTPITPNNNSNDSDRNLRVNQSVTKNIELLVDLNSLSLYLNKSDKYAEYINLEHLLILCLRTRSSDIESMDTHTHHSSMTSASPSSYIHLDKAMDYCSLHLRCSCVRNINETSSPSTAFLGLHCCHTCQSYIKKQQLPVLLTTILNALIHNMIQLHTPLYYSFYSFYSMKHHHQHHPPTESDLDFNQNNSHTLSSNSDIHNSPSIKSMLIDQDSNKIKIEKETSSQKDLLLTLSNALRYKFQLLYTVLKIMLTYDEGYKLGNTTLKNINEIFIKNPIGSSDTVNVTLDEFVQKMYTKLCDVVVICVVDAIHTTVEESNIDISRHSFTNQNKMYIDIFSDLIRSLCNLS